MFEGSGEILLEDGTPAITATGKYLKMDITTITDADFENEAWEVLRDTGDPETVEL